MAIPRIQEIGYSRSSLIAGTEAPEPVQADDPPRFVAPRASELPEPTGPQADEISDARQWIDFFAQEDADGYAALRLTRDDIAGMEYDAATKSLVLPRKPGATEEACATFLRFILDHANDDPVRIRFR